MTIFYVYQGKTYKEEKAGGFVWSPKVNKKGHPIKGYTMMTKIKKNDFILHHCKKKLVAISVAQTDCFDFVKQSDKYNENNVEGYRVDTVYTQLEAPLDIEKYESWLKSNPKRDSAFKKNGEGVGKEQYMNLIDDEHAIFLLEKAINQQSNSSVIKLLNEALSDVGGGCEDEYEYVEKEVICNFVDNQSDKIEDWPEVIEPQKMKLSTSSGKEFPERNSKIAAQSLAKADYRCEYDKEHMIFERKSGKGYTEPHHLIPISKYRDFYYKKCSLDVMENIVSLCSHCHNLLHYGKYEDKEPILKKLYDERKNALAKVELDIAFDKLTKYYK